MLMVAMRSLERAISSTARKPARRLDGEGQAQVPGREAARALQAIDPRDDVADLRGRFRLGDRQAIEPGVHHGVDVVGEQGRVVVHPDQHLGAAPAGEGERIPDEHAGARLLLRGHRVLEVEDDGVRAAGVRLLHEVPHVDGKNQRRATGLRDGHRQMTPFWASAAMRSSE